MKPIITILAVNYNTSDFLRVSIKALNKLTKNPWKLLIADNGSDRKDFIKLRRYVSQYDNVFLISREQSLFGSTGHGEALNILSQFIDTEYGVILDADCFPLLNGWDELLINQLDDRHTIIGTPLEMNAEKTDKPNDFPLICLCLFETSVFKELKIDFRPKDLSLFQDTGWELREKYRKSGFTSKNLYGLNTRFYKEGPFKNTICVVYYDNEDKEQLVCSHFGRGSNPGSSKYANGIIGRLVFRNRYYKDKKLWLSICDRIIDIQAVSIERKSSN